MIIYDATHVDLIGVNNKLFIAYENVLVVNGWANSALIQEAVAPHNGERICLDVEMWKFDLDDYVLNADSMARYKQLINLAKLHAPDSDIGLFLGQWSNEPFRNTEDWNKSRKLMDYLAPMYAAMDTIYPSFYTYYDKIDLWKAYVSAVMAELFQYQKPFIPFMWHKYPGDGPVGGTDIGGDMFHEMLKFIESLSIDAYPLPKPYLDGVAIWVKSDETRPATSAPWWIELQRFL